jgi:hypothetical protein
MNADELKPTGLNPKEPHATNPASDSSQAGDAAKERAAREQSFTRRGLLQWSVPAIAAVTLPQALYAGTPHNDGHDDKHHDKHHDGHHDDSKPGRKPDASTSGQKSDGSKRGQKKDQ